MADKEYIEREALDDFKDELMSRFIVLCLGNDYNKLNLLTIGNQIDELYEKHSTRPAADVVEVRYGEWVKDDDDVCWWLECSVCGEIPPKNRYGYYWQSAYCPNCGAKMDGKGDAG